MEREEKGDTDWLDWNKGDPRSEGRCLRRRCRTENRGIRIPEMLRVPRGIGIDKRNTIRRDITLRIARLCPRRRHACLFLLTLWSGQSTL